MRIADRVRFYGNDIYIFNSIEISVKNPVDRAIKEKTLTIDPAWQAISLAYYEFIEG